jgi:hypothetical protein
MTKTAIIGDFFLMYCEVQYCPLFKVRQHTSSLGDDLIVLHVEGS